jgi:hypothetical protein
MSGGDPPQANHQTLPKLKLVIPLKRKEETKSDAIKSEKLAQPSLNLNLDLPRISMERCLNKATQYTYQQLEVFYELLPRMTDLERKNNLAVLAQSASRLWGELKSLYTSLRDDLPVLERAMNGIEFCKRESAVMGKSMAEFNYQNGAMSGCCLKKFPVNLLNAVLSERVFGFSHNIHKFITPLHDDMDEMFKFFIAKEAHFLVKTLGGGQIVSLENDRIGVMILEEFLLEFTVIPARTPQAEGDGQYQRPLNQCKGGQQFNWNAAISPASWVD